MKLKQLTILSCCGLLLAGCSGAATNVTDSGEKLMTIGKVTYTKGDEYQLIKKVNGASLTLQAAQKLIYDQEIGETDEVKKEAQEMYDSYASSTEGFEDQLKSYGYADAQDYITTVLVPSIQSQKLVEKYFEEAKEEIETEYKPVLASIIQCDSEDNANKAKAALEEGQDAGKVAGEYAKEGATYTGAQQVVTTLDTTLPARLLNMLQETTETGVLPEVFSDDTATDDKSYYVAVLDSKDYDANIEAIISALSSNSTVSEQCVTYYLKKYDFNVHDQFIFDYFKANNPQYLVSRPDLAENAEAASGN